MITLSLLPFSVTFDRFLDTDYPRTVISKSLAEFSINGTPSIGGPLYPAKHIWTIHAPCNNYQRDLIEAIADESDSLRRSLVDCSISIYDMSATIKERSPRTRALVPGTSELPVGDGSYVAYYPVCKGVITEPIKFGILGAVDSVAITLTESVLVPA